MSLVVFIKCRLMIRMERLERVQKRSLQIVFSCYNFSFEGATRHVTEMLYCLLLCTCLFLLLVIWKDISDKDDKRYTVVNLFWILANTFSLTEQWFYVGMNSCFHKYVLVQYLSAMRCDSETLLNHITLVSVIN